MRLRQVCCQSPQAGRAEAGATEGATQERIRAAAGLSGQEDGL